MSNTTVQDNMVVSLDYTLRLDDGQVVDTSSDAEPLEFLQGRGQIIPGLEKKLYGMEVGEEREVVVPPDDGYGEFDPEAFQQVPMEAFPEDMELQAGMGMELMNEAGEPFLAFVSEVGPESVVLDFNHPLAGETLYFTVKIAGVRQATDEELAHGHVHGHDSHHG